MGLILLNFLLICVILGRRYLWRRAYVLKEERRLLWAHAIDKALEEASIPARVPVWQGDWDRDAADEAFLQRWEIATYAERTKLRSLFRVWGLLDARRQAIHQGNKWKRVRSALILARFHFYEVLPELLWLLPAVPKDTQVAIVNALELLGDPIACDPLMDFLSKEGFRRSRPVLSALIACCRSEPARLVPYLTNEQAQVREVAAEALVFLVTPNELPSLLEAVQDSSPEVRAKVARALVRISAPECFAALKQLVVDPIWFVRLQAVGSLAELKLPEVTEVLFAATRDDDWRVRAAAALALYRHVPDAVQLLQEMQGRVQDRYAIEAVVAALEHDGATWRAIEGLLDPEPATRDYSRDLLIELLRLGTVASILCALETHPNREARHAVFRLLKENAKPSIRVSLGDMVESPWVEEEIRQGVKNLLAGWDR